MRYCPGTGKRPACKASRKSTLIPGSLQNFVELCVEKLDNFVCGILGPRGRRFTPFLGTLFVYILCMNVLGLLPIMKSPTSSINTTAALAICVFLYVQYTGISFIHPPESRMCAKAPIK